MNYYPFHIGDYLSATRHLSWEEDAAFRRLLDVYYTSEKPLPLEPRQVCRLVLAATDTQREAVQVVLDEFFEKTPEGWINRRADTEIQSMREKQQKQRDKANKMWDKRRAAEPVTDSGSASAVPQQGADDAAASKTDANALPPTPTPTPTPTPKKKKGAKAPLSADELPPWMQTLVNLYHEVLPELPGCRVMDKDRQQAIRDFWDWVLTTKRPDGTRRATTEDEAHAWARDYFERARGNDFIMGRGHRSPEHANWRCSIEYLLSSRGMKKVLEETAVPA